MDEPVSTQRTEGVSSASKSIRGVRMRTLHCSPREYYREGMYTTVLLSWMLCGCSPVYGCMQKGSSSGTS